VRVAAASSYIEVAAGPQPTIRILEDGLNSKNLLTRDVAAYALAHADPKNSKLAPLLRPKKLRSRRKRSRTSTIIHGTWASSGTWWQPDDDFWTYLHNNVDPPYMVRLIASAGAEVTAMPLAPRRELPCTIGCKPTISTDWTCSPIATEAA